MHAVCTPEIQAHFVIDPTWVTSSSVEGGIVAFLIWITETMIAVDNNWEMGVFRLTPVEAATYKAALVTGRIKYTRTGGKKVGGSRMALDAWEARMSRAHDQLAPCGRETYADAHPSGYDGMYEIVRWRYTCPWTKEQWICEKTSLLYTQ